MIIGVKGVEPSAPWSQTNLVGTALSILGESGRKLNRKSILIENIHLELNDVYDNNNFYPTGYTKPSNGSYQHYFPPSHSSELGFSIFTFFVEKTDSYYFREYL